jgi:hypothetical protein
VQQLNRLMCRRLSTWSHDLDHNWCPRFRKFTDFWAFNSPLMARSKRRKIKSWFGSNDYYQPSGKFVSCMDWEDHMLPTINKIQELVRWTRRCGLGFRDPFL